MPDDPEHEAVRSAVDALTPRQLERYSRQTVMPEIGPEGQRRLLASKVLIVGVGGLGSPAALYLAAAGVGRLGLVDGDRVDLSNLQRQVIHGTADVGSPKVDSAAARLKNLNPDVAVKTYPQRMDLDALVPLVREYEFVIDGADSNESKVLVNRAACLAWRPCSSAGVGRFGGQVMTFIPGRSACYECVFRPPGAEIADPARAGVLGAVPGILGAIQAAEAIKFLLGQGDLLEDCLLTIETLTMAFRKLKVRRDPRCRTCGSL